MPSGRQLYDGRQHLMIMEIAPWRVTGAPAKVDKYGLIVVHNPVSCSSREGVSMNKRRDFHTEIRRGKFRLRVALLAIIAGQRPFLAGQASNGATDGFLAR